jgi:hypothetical protein
MAKAQWVLSWHRQSAIDGNRSLLEEAEGGSGEDERR